MTRSVRRLSPCPPKLKAIIELVNLVPATVDLPNPMALFCPSRELPLHIEAKELVEGLLLLPKAFQEEVLNTLYRRCRPRSDQVREFAEQAEVLAQHLQITDATNHVLGMALHSIRSAAENNQFLSFRRGMDFANVRHNEPLLELLQNARTDFTLVIGLMDLAELYSFVWRSRDHLREIGKNDSHYFPLTRLSIDAEGLIQIDKDLFEDAVEGVKAARLRECVICRQMFWVGRSDQLCCTPRCNHIRHSRLSRRKHTSSSKVSDRHKLAEVRKAIKAEALTPAAISIKTALALDEVSRLINLLTDRGEADWNAREETVYLKDSAKKGK